MSNYHQAKSALRVLNQLTKEIDNVCLKGYGVKELKCGDVVQSYRHGLATVCETSKNGKVRVLTHLKNKVVDVKLSEVKFTK